MTSYDERNEPAAGVDDATPPAGTGGVAFFPSALLHAGLPVLAPGASDDWVRASRTVTLRMRPGVDAAGHPIGLPFGSIARLLISWITSEAMMARSPEIRLGCSVSTFMWSLGYESRAQTGGANGTVTRVKEQVRRLLTCSAMIERHRDGTTERGELWTPSSDQGGQAIGSMVSLSEFFMKEIMEHSVPVDRTVVLGLTGSPLSMDVYWWLSWRFSFLRGEQKVAWEQLQQQFGLLTQQTKKFKETFTGALERVRKVYPDMQVATGPYGLTLRPSRTSVPRLRR